MWTDLAKCSHAAYLISIIISPKQLHLTVEFFSMISCYLYHTHFIGILSPQRRKYRAMNIVQIGPTDGARVTLRVPRALGWSWRRCFLDPKAAPTPRWPTGDGAPRHNKFGKLLLIYYGHFPLGVKNGPSTSQSQSPSFGHHHHHHRHHRRHQRHHHHCCRRRR